MRYYKNRLTTILFLILISITFLLVGLDQVNEAVDPAYEDTGSYLEGALFIKENGGVLNFLNLCLSGQYKIESQHPLYLLLLSPFASRELSFFPKAKLLSLVIGLIVVVSLFFITKNLFEQNVSFIASVLLAFNIPFLERSSTVASETLLILFILLSWYFMVKGLDNNKYWILAGISSGLAYMAKGTGIFTIPIFVISNLLISRLRIIKNKYFWLFFLFFLISSSPLIMRNIIAYKNPLYEGINSNVPWLDSYGELSDPKYELLVNWQEHTYSARNLPTILSYIETHSFSKIAKRTVEGIRGELGLLLKSMYMLIIPKGKLYFSFILFVLFFFGLIRDKDKRRTIYTIITILVFFFPCAWYFQVIPHMRFITPLIPLLCIYSSLGCIELIKYIDGKLLVKYERFSLSSIIPYALTVFLVLISGYFIATQKVYPLVHPIELSDDQQELFGWLKENVKEDDIVILGPTNHYWGYLWYANFKGKLVPAAGNVALAQENFEAFDAYLKKRNVNLIVLHKENYLSPKILGDYFEYNETNGLIEKKPINNEWKLIYKYSKKPTKFLIYRIEH